MFLNVNVSGKKTRPKSCW